LSATFLESRVARFKKQNQSLAALDEIRLIRSKFAEQIDADDIAAEEVLKEALLIMKERPPFRDKDFLEKVDWENCRQAIRDFIEVLRQAGLQDGSLAALSADLKDQDTAYRLCAEAFDWESPDFAVESARYGVEPDLVRLILMTPFLPVYKKLLGMVPRSDAVRQVRSCGICGSRFSLGVYQGGFRFLVCSLCGSRSAVDYFFCPNCANTDPQRLEFIRVHEEPALELDICARCGAYIKAVHEDLMGAIVEDPILLDLATMDLDALAKEKLEKAAG